MKQHDNTIKAYCTVERNELSRTESSYHCNKCSRNLLNLSDPKIDRSKLSKASGIACGIFAAVAMSSCSTVDPDIPLPGIYFSEEEIDSKGGLYPTAKAVEGEDGIVISPYGGHQVNVSRIPLGSLVIDPQYPAEDLKLFRF